VDLFEQSAPDTTPGRPAAPLAERLRPRKLAEFHGQEHLLGPGGVLRRMLDAGALPASLLFWGPPGAGKTTLARLIAQHLDAVFVAFSAVTASVQDVRAVVEKARLLRQRGKSLVLFVDEVHRFNRAQQDAFLPHVEDGTLRLLGATTENPSFAVNAALLSRARVLELLPLPAAAIEAILQRALQDPERGLGALPIVAEPGVLARLAVLADGDARTALNVLEILAAPAAPERPVRLTLEALGTALARRNLGLDRGGEEHYNLISALHKSLRGGDADAGLYWLARLLEAGEDPMYVARRLLRFASEDVGLAEPRALPLVVAAAQTVAMIGMPEAELALAQAVLFLATAPKSNRVDRAYAAARDDVRQHGNPAVPLQLRNAPTRLLRELGRGVGYLDPHAAPDAIVLQDYLPPSLSGRQYYEPSEAGEERQIAARLAHWRAVCGRLRAGARVAAPPAATTTGPQRDAAGAETGAPTALPESPSD